MQKSTRSPYKGRSARLAVAQAIAEANSRDHVTTGANPNRQLLANTHMLCHMGSFLMLILMVRSILGYNE
jgi:hypothetical protein